MDKPQIIEHSALPLNYTIFDVKWIPCSAKFLVMGSKPKGTGVIQIFELNEAKPQMIKEIERKVAFKCGSFGASSLRNRHLAVADFEGRLQVLDLERPELPVYSVAGHKTIINCIDAVGGKQVDCGPPEIVTGSRDGSVKVWDIRQGKDPVVDITPDPEDGGDGAPKARDCWAVAFGDSYNNSDRIVAAGYDNGDLRLFDLRALSVRWEKTEKNGIVSIEFDRQDIPMNKMAVTTLEGGLIVYDMRTQHETKGFASVSEKNAGRSVGTNGVITGPKSTVWGVKHLPQNRDVFITCGGTGSVRLWEYEYPDRRRRDDGDGKEVGVAGTLSMINATTISSQPVNCFDWNPDKIGLAVCGSFDQTVRVLVTTRMNIY